MNKSRLLGAVCACLLVISHNASASIITHGSLTTNDDGSTNIITDGLNDLEWLRFDVLAPLTYTETVNVLGTQDGGGWNIANTAHAIMFIDAFFAPSSHDCSVSSTAVTNCGASAALWTIGDFGPNWTALGDIVFYTDDNINAGLLTFFNTGDVYTQHDWSTIGISDSHSAEGINSDEVVSWLLYRPATSVPIPPALWLFGSGLLGLIGMARRKP